MNEQLKSLSKLFSDNLFRIPDFQRGYAWTQKEVDEFWNGGALDSESNVQFGEGGAGTFSDGKLTTGISDIRCREVLKVFAANGAKEEILTDAKAHIGTDILAVVITFI